MSNEKSARDEEAEDEDFADGQANAQKAYGVHNILFVESDDDSAKMVLDAVAKNDTFVFDLAKTGAEAVEKFSEKKYDLVILNYILPDTDGLDVLEKMKKADDSVPIIMLTPRNFGNIAREAARIGVTDCVVKTFEYYSDIEQEVMENIEKHHQLMLEKEHKMRILDEKQNLDTLLMSMGEAVCKIGADYTLRMANTEATNVYGGGIVGKKCFEVFRRYDSPCFDCRLPEVLKTKKPVSSENTDISKSGGMVISNVVLSPIKDASGEVREVVRSARDVTERKKVEQKLTESFRRLQTQHAVKSVLIEVVPLLLAGAPRELKFAFINEMCGGVERLFWKESIEKGDTPGETLGLLICKAMGELGGRFSVSDYTKNSCVIRVDQCPWEEGAGINPVLCMVCRGIASRFGIRVLGDSANVGVERTIANGDNCCIINIMGYE